MTIKRLYYRLMISLVTLLPYPYGEEKFQYYSKKYEDELNIW